MKQVAYIIIAMLLPLNLLGQGPFKFKGQLSGVVSYSPNNDLDWFFGRRYIPEISYKAQLDSIHKLDFNMAFNLDYSSSLHPFSDLESETDSNTDIYRAWARYSGENYEIRLGLQKIDFGSASILRPLRWFDQVDPRDPLGLTPGVWGLLGRYYFLNNANIWLWGLYGNENPKGWEVIDTYETIPEFGGRFQHPVPRGELALSYHHRVADSRNLGVDSLAIDKIPENRIGIDGKWDVGVGLWFEASQSIKQKKIGPFTNQTIATVGMDYTFGIGSGLNVVGEHMMAASYEGSPDFSDAQHITAATAS